MKKGKKFNLFEFHKIFDNDVLMLYKGPFDNHVLSVFTKYIEGIILKHPQISKKIFSIFIELAQNIAFYSAEATDFEEEKTTGIGTLVISEHDRWYTFFTGNAVRNDDIMPLIEKCEIINSLDRAGLRKYKREQYKLPPGKKGTAHVGLIQVALTANNQIDIEVSPIDEETSFFAISVRINKKSEDILDNGL